MPDGVAPAGEQAVEGGVGRPSPAVAGHAPAVHPPALLGEPGECAIEGVGLIGLVDDQLTVLDAAELESISSR